MTDDKFDDASRAIVRALIRAMPGGGAALGLVQDLFPDPTEEFERKILLEVHGDVAELRQRVAQLEADLHGAGKELEDPGALRRAQFTDEAMRAIATAQSETKKDAVMNAIVHQFDPRVGSQSARRFWLDTVKQLHDAEVEAIRFLGASLDGSVFFNERQVRFADGTHVQIIDAGTKSEDQVYELLRPIPLAELEAATLHSALLQLTSSEPALVESGRGRFTGQSPPNWFRLTPGGRALLQLIAPVAEKP